MSALSQPPLQNLPVSLGACVSYLARLFKDNGLLTPALDARLLISHAARTSKEDMLAAPDRLLDEAQTLWIAQSAEARLQGTPVSRLIGRRGFWKADFALSPHVLDPRAESETLIEAALPRLQAIADAPVILDLGTGSGALLLSLLSEREDALGVGIDISEKALRQAKKNALSLGLQERASFLAADWAGALGNLGQPEGVFDLILANPPYIPSAALKTLSPEVRHDPKIALDGGSDGLRATARIVQSLPPLLKKEGCAILELGVRQDKQVQAMAEESGLVLGGLKKDLLGIPRALLLEKGEKQAA